MGQTDLNKELGMIVEISRLVTSSRDFNSIKDEVIDKMLSIISPKKACVNIFERYEHDFVYLVCKKTLKHIPELFAKNVTNKGIKIPYLDYPEYIRESVEKQIPIYIRDLSKDIRAKDELEMARLEGYVGRAVFPLVSSNNTVGFMTCFLAENEELSSTDMDFIASVASLLGLSMETTRSHSDSDKLVRKLRKAISSIETATEELYQNKGIDSFLNMASKQICKLTNSKGTMIVLYDEDIPVNTIAGFGYIKALPQIKEYLSLNYNENVSSRVFTQMELPDSLKNEGIFSLIYETLKKDDRNIGHIIAVNSIRYYDDDLKVMGIYSTQIILSLVMFLNARKIFDSKLMERDLEIVARQQELIMSDQHVKLSDGVTIDYFYSPSRQIGGDFCKIYRIDDNKAIVFIADVMGHGILSNYFVAMMKGVLKTLMSEKITPSELMERLNQTLFSDLDALSLFITARMLYLDFETNIAIGSNAGHLAPIQLQKTIGGIKKVSMDIEEGIPIGVMQDSEYEQHTYDISDSKLIALYTDGIIEAGNMDEKQFGEEGLCDFLVKNIDKTGIEICSEVLQELQDFTKAQYTEDDVMLVIIKRENKRKNI